MKDKNQPKILFLDIETAPALAWTWGLRKVNIGIDQIEKDDYILMFAAKWQGETKILWDAGWNYTKDPAQYCDKGEKKLLQNVWRLLDEADIVVAHNGDEFDLKWISGQFLKHGMPPPATIRQIDTLKEARNTGRHISNKLDYLCRKFKLGQKVDTGGFDLWKHVMRGSTEYQAKMVSYCQHDTRLLQKLYLVLRPFMKNHPNVNPYRQDGRMGCSVCPSTRIRKKGIWISSRGIQYQRHICFECGHNMRDRISIKPIKTGPVSAL